MIALVSQFLRQSTDKLIEPNWGKDYFPSPHFSQEQKMDIPKTLDDLLNDYGFLEITPEDDGKDYGDVTDPDQVKGFWLDDMDEFERMDIEE